METQITSQRQRNHKVTVTDHPLLRFTEVSRSHWWQVSQEQAIGLSSFLLSDFPNFGLGCWHVERTKLLYSISPMCVLPWNPGESLQTSSVYRAQVKTLPKVCLFIYLFIYSRWIATPMGDKLKCIWCKQTLTTLLPLLCRALGHWSTKYSVFPETCPVWYNVRFGVHPWILRYIEVTFGHTLPRSVKGGLWRGLPLLLGSFVNTFCAPPNACLLNMQW